MLKQRSKHWSNFAVLRFFLSICFSFSFVHLSQAVTRGGDGSGGGSYVTVGGKKMLVDLYVNNGSFGVDSLPLPPSLAMKRIGIDLLRNQKGPLLPEVKKRIQSWAFQYPILANAMLETLNSAPIYLVDSIINVRDPHFDLENKAGTDSVTTGALTMANFGTLISYPEIKTVDSESQIAMINHEIFRLLFIVQGENDVSPKKIQRLNYIFSQNSNLSDEIGKLDFLGESLSRVIELFRKTKQVSEFAHADQVCSKLIQSEFLKTYNSAEVLELKSACATVEKTSNFNDTFFKDLGRLADSLEVLLESQGSNEASLILASTQDRRAEKYSTDSSIRLDFYRQSRAHARALREAKIDRAIFQLERNSSTNLQSKVEFNNMALNLGTFGFILNAGIDEANAAEGDTKIIRAAKDALEVLKGIGILK